MLTPKQTQEAAKISATTLRRYVNKFGDHLSETANKKRGRRYTNDDLAIILKIKDLYRDGFDDDQIDQQLSLIEPGQADIGELAILYPTIAKPIKEALDMARFARSRLDDVTDRQDRSESRLEAQEKEIERLRRQNRTALILIALAIVGIVVLYFLTGG